MADRKVQYIIEMIANDQKIRQQLSSWKWEDIIGAKGKGFSDVLVIDEHGDFESGCVFRSFLRDGLVL